MITSKRIITATGLLFFVLNFTTLHAQVITSSQIDSLAELNLKNF